MSVVANHKTLPVGYDLLWYKIQGILGHGGFGITYLAMDTNLDRLVAVKEYLPSMFARRHEDYTVAPLTSDQGDKFEWGLSRFLTEAQTLARFKHKNIVQVQTVFEQNGTAYMVMEYEQGQSLAKLFHQNPAAFGQPLIESILFPIMDGLQLVHNAGFIHRDIKPANIYIREDKSPVLIDFGSARQTSIQSTGEMTALVSQGYTPPEQYSASFGEQGPWTDIYSFAASAYHGITGKIAEDSLHRSAAVQFGKPDPLRPLKELVGKDFSDRFVEAMDLALNLDSHKRPQSLREWRAEFLDDDDKTVFAPLLGSKELGNKKSSANAESDKTNVLPLIASSSTDTPQARRRAPGLSSDSSPAARSAANEDDHRSQMPRNGRARGVPAKLKFYVGDALRRLQILSERVVDNWRRKCRVESLGSATISLTRLKKINSGNYLLATLAALFIVIFIAGGAWLFYPKGETPAAFSVTAVLPTLPATTVSIELRSPVDRARLELTELIQVGTAYIKALEADPQSAQAQLGIRFVADRIKRLGNWSVVQVHPELRPALSAALVFLGRTQPQFTGLISDFENSPGVADIAEVKQLLIKENLTALEKQRLVFGLAFLPPIERRKLEPDKRVAGLMSSFKQAIVAELQLGRFSRAAQMLEVALLLTPNDSDLAQLTEHLLN